MNIALVLTLADDGWGMHDGDIGVGWWIVMATLMVVFMGGMMWMMMRGMGGGSSAPGETGGTAESPLDILERRLAEGAISVEEYRARREALVNGTAEPDIGHEDQPLAVAGRENGGAHGPGG